MHSTTHEMRSPLVWRESLSVWLLCALVFAALLMAFAEGLWFMYGRWMEQEEYSHGILLPVIALFLIWQKKNDIETQAYRGSWVGLGVTLFGFFVFLLGELSTLYPVIQYSFLLVLIGLVIAQTGLKSLRFFWPSMVILAFMVPLPNFIFQNLSAQLQLISSQIGVAVIRWFDISVFLEGNVIDLGSYQLQVVEACNGLRYLFPLMTIGFIMAYFFKAPLWQRLVVFISTVPITVLMNSFRIGVIGVTVEYWGQSMAEGFLHDFEGWVIFMSCMLVLFLEMWLLVKLGKANRSLQTAFGLELPSPTPKDAQVRVRGPEKPFIATIILSLFLGLGSVSLPDRQEVIPYHPPLVDFPLTLGPWQGVPDRLQQKYIDILKFDDYLFTDYYLDERRVNLYIAYYASQRKGQSAHSPRSCIPGGGWRITQLDRLKLDDVLIDAEPLRVNRVVITKGGTRQLVYYWFQQRGRLLTNEYLVKYYMFKDALIHNRTDGALVRLTALVAEGQDIAEVDRDIQGFVKAMEPVLQNYIPGKELD